MGPWGHLLSLRQGRTRQPHPCRHQTHQREWLHPRRCCYSDYLKMKASCCLCLFAWGTSGEFRPNGCVSSRVWHNLHRLWASLPCICVCLCTLHCLCWQQVQCALSLLLSAMHWPWIASYLSNGHRDSDKCKSNKSKQASSKYLFWHCRQLLSPVVCIPGVYRHTNSCHHSTPLF